MRKIIFAILGICISTAIVMFSLFPLESDRNVASNWTQEEVLALLADAHTQYERIYVQYDVRTGEDFANHTVWLDSTTQQFRHEIHANEGLVQLTMSDGEQHLTLNSPTGSPLISPLMLIDDIPLANQRLGGIGTLISPVRTVTEGRLSQSSITINSVETYTFNSPLTTLTVLKVQAQLQDFTPHELWIDIDTGIIVREILYHDDGNIRTITSLSEMTLDDPASFANDMLFSIEGFVDNMP